MNTPFSRMRRFAIAASALLLAACLFRSQIAQALVLRGDDYLYQGRVPEAQERYERALTFDSGLEVAADRFVFVSMERHTRTSLERGIRAATKFLRAQPNDVSLLADRGLCYLVARKYMAARQDFVRAAAISGSASDFVFAGWAARRAGDRVGARRLWRRALEEDPRNRSARIALAERGS